MEIKRITTCGDIGRLRPGCWVKNAGRIAKIQRICDDVIKVNIKLGRTRMSKMNYTWHAENCTEIKSMEKSQDCGERKRTELENENTSENSEKEEENTLNPTLSIA